MASVTARFDYWADSQGVAPPGHTFSCDPGFYASSPMLELDYALVRLTEDPLHEFMSAAPWEDLPALELLRKHRHRGYLLASPRRVTDDERVNVVQHPGGSPLKAVLTQNRVAAVSDTRLQYVADTEPGSSGSPVFDRNWNVIALHHSGQPLGGEKDTSATLKRYLRGKFSVNEGIPMTVILKDLEKKGLMALLPH